MGLVHFLEGVVVAAIVAGLTLGVLLLLDRTFGISREIERQEAKWDRQEAAEENPPPDGPGGPARNAW